MSTTTMTTPSESRRRAATAPGDPDAGSERETVKILLVDDDRAASYSLWALLSWQPGIRACATAESGVEAIGLAQRLSPDVCLVAAALGVGEGMEVSHRLTQLPGSPRVLVYGEHSGPEFHATAVIAGADGVLWRYGDPDELARTIRRTAAGEHEPQAVAHDAIRALIDHVEDHDRPIASMLLLRVPADEIAGTLGVSASHLRARRREIVKRLGRLKRLGRRVERQVVRRIGRAHDHGRSGAAFGALGRPCRMNRGWRGVAADGVQSSGVPRTGICP